MKDGARVRFGLFDTIVGAIRRTIARLRGRPEASVDTGAPFGRSPDGRPLASRGELLISRWLDAHGYVWEYEARVGGFTPDFVLRDHRILIEYWGMKGHNRSYDAKIVAKRARYRDHGWTLIGVERKHLARLDERLGRKLKQPKKPA